MKRIFLILIAAVLLLALVACGGESDSPKTTALSTTQAPTSTPAVTTAPEAPTSTPAVTTAPEVPTSTPAVTTAPEVPTSTPAVTSAPTTPVVTTPTPVQTSKAPADTSVPEAMDKTEWDETIAEKNFDNYTLIMEGVMTVTQNGVELSTSSVKETVRITADKMQVILLADDVNSDEADSQTLLLEGDQAMAQKLQYEQVFLALLAQYDSFVYDEQTNTYTVKEPITFDMMMKGIRIDHETGEMMEFETPAKMEMKNGTVSFSNDGKLAKFVCDYAQTMLFGESDVTTAGITTWTFSDYGTTVIE